MATSTSLYTPNFYIFSSVRSFYFNYPAWTLILTTIYVIAYLYVLHFEQKIIIINIAWLYMLVYIFYMTFSIDGGMVWFNFYITNLLAFRFQDKIFLLKWKLSSYLI